MRAKYVTGVTVTDLGAKAPFLQNYTAVVVNANTSARTLQFGDASTGPFNTGRQPDRSLATVPAGGAIEVVISGRYAALEGGSGQLIILGN